ncbi:MAG: multidrug ABC transporter ATP-binding protein [Bdellovibrionales bacterium CG10_big_fil_rev_8_21_14_0_10_45_34]|nr:MAG: multidrug ABC transporter ATP-binding protein [Bdellovibrionales bacterium CG10_big_fil_rev_8_21_14_0_10_45_34]
MILDVSGLTKRFKNQFWAKPHYAVKDVSFRVKEGSITGFLGANGSGKTTSIKNILGLIYPDAGEITYFGGKPLSNEVKKRIGFLPERPYFYEYLTGTEFLQFYADLSGLKRGPNLRKRIQTLLEKVELPHAADRPLRKYSKGMLQRIGIAQALIHDPDFVILDEPMTGLDPDGRRTVAEIIKDCRKRGATIFFSSHLLHDVETLCDELVILVKGEVKYSGSTQDLLKRAQAGYRLVSIKDSSPQSERVVDQHHLQKRMRDLLDSQAQIIEVIAERPSLEELFIEMSRKGSQEQVEKASN